MNFHSHDLNSPLDERTRRYIIPTGIVWSSGKVCNSKLLLKFQNGQATAKNNSEFILGPGSAVLLDFGKELNGGVKIITGKFAGNNIRRLRIRFGESVSEAMGKPDNDHAIHDSIIDIASIGTTEFGNTGFRFVRLDNVETNMTIEIKEVLAVFLYRDLEYRGSFECDNQLLNEIWQTSAYTVQLCLQDYAWDGIKRDRLVWMGDLFFELVTVAYVFGKLPIIEKSMDFLRCETVLPACMNGSVSYSMWWILAQKLWYDFYGDKQYLIQQREYMVKLLHILAGQIDGNGAADLSGGWQLLDWATGSDASPETVTAVHAGNHALLKLALEAGIVLCQVLNEVGCMNKCRSAINKMKSHIPPKSTSQSANALQVLAGILDPDETNNNFFRKKAAEGLSPSHGYLVLEARAMAGDYSACLELIRKYWGGMLKLGATTFWEHFDLTWVKNAARIDELVPNDKTDIHQSYGEGCFKGWRHSLCHGWSGGPAAWLAKHILGIQLAVPGASVINLHPHLPGLKWAHGSFQTPYGNIKVEVERRGDTLQTVYQAPKEIKVNLKSDK
jgi:hypothetical protein